MLIYQNLIDKLQSGKDSDRDLDAELWFYCFDHSATDKNIIKTMSELTPSTVIDFDPHFIKISATWRQPFARFPGQYTSQITDSLKLARIIVGSEWWKGYTIECDEEDENNNRVTIGYGFSRYPDISRSILIAALKHALTVKTAGDR